MYEVSTAGYLERGINDLSKRPGYVNVGLLYEYSWQFNRPLQDTMKAVCQIQRWCGIKGEEDRIKNFANRRVLNASYFQAALECRTYSPQERLGPNYPSPYDHNLEALKDKVKTEGADPQDDGRPLCDIDVKAKSPG